MLFLLKWEIDPHAPRIPANEHLHWKLRHCSHIEFHLLNSNVFSRNKFVDRKGKKTLSEENSHSVIFRWFKWPVIFLVFNHSLKVMIKQVGLTCGHFRCMTEVRHLASRLQLAKTAPSSVCYQPLPPRLSSSHCQSGRAFRNILFQLWLSIACWKMP